MDIRSNMLLISSTKDNAALNVCKLIGASTSAMVSSIGDSTSCDIKAGQKSGFLSRRVSSYSWMYSTYVQLARLYKDGKIRMLSDTILNATEVEFPVGLLYPTIIPIYTSP